jgi:phosphatidylserine synthase
VSLIVWAGVAIAMPSQSKVKKPDERLSKHNSELIQLFGLILFIVFMMFIVGSYYSTH